MPSDLLGIENSYEAFCFNEACMYISSKLRDGEKANWIDAEVETKEEKRRNAASLAAMLREGTSK